MGRFRDMSWIDGKYYYSVRVLKAIASNYAQIYEGISFNGHTVVNPWSLAEYKADFDIALSAIGKGRWGGIKSKGNFGRLQKVIIADILGIKDYVNRVSQMRGYAYHLMADRLNGIPHHGTKTQFTIKPR